MSGSEIATIARFSVDALDVLVYESRALAGRAAAQAVAEAIAMRLSESGKANVIFAAAPSQNEFLAGLVADKAVDWTRVIAFHMDEYLGIRRRPSGVFPPIPPRASVPAGWLNRRSSAADYQAKMSSAR